MATDCDDMTPAEICTNGGTTPVSNADDKDFFKPDAVVTIRYRNYRGEVAIRRIVPIGRFYQGCNRWHPELQWLLDAYDVDKGAERTFAFKDMCPLGAPQAEEVVLPPDDGPGFGRS